MTIYGKDCFFIYGIEKILKQLRHEQNVSVSADWPYVYCTAGMDIQETYSLFFTTTPMHYSVFITSERYFDSINRLFPGLVKLCLPERVKVAELKQALWVMCLLSAQNQKSSYLPDTFKFTNAEHQIMKLIMRGHSLDDIAQIRGVSPTTISVQRNGLMKRTGTKSLQELCSVYAAMRTN
ncbi:helix-turn-helix transcriptional regulator [Klebsiella indica]|uniref:Helix-turn-helix transcriptional regulator n=1 Tax=Klebsiella indica TaxID=2582917 RepID=A0A5R9LNB9_9ENTR|nr:MULTISPECIES: helix-turn-helix transcriptional regulator [Klebsiella]TLV22395.1 helix-turn-helix transcriptional regulator [Klebsiella indica]